MARRGRPPAPTPPVPRRQPRGASGVGTVEAILTAAERVLATRGGSLTTNLVAEVAGVSVGSLYQYFPNKEALVRAIYERYLAQFVAVLPRVLVATEGRPFREIAAGIADAYVDVYRAQAPVHRWLWQMRTAAGLHALIAQALGRMVELATAALVAQRVSAAEARTLAFVIVHSIDGLANALTIQPDGPAAVEPRAAARTIADMVARHVEALGRD